MSVKEPKFEFSFEAGLVDAARAGYRHKDLGCEASPFIGQFACHHQCHENAIIASLYRL